MTPSVADTLREIAESAPESQIDPALKQGMLDLAQKETITSDNLLQLLDHGAYFSSASEFVMGLLHFLMANVAMQEGKTIEQVFEEAKPRRDKDDYSLKFL